MSAVDAKKSGAWYQTGTGYCRSAARASTDADADASRSPRR